MNLSGAILVGANLTFAQFFGADLTNADFRDADLTNAANLGSATSGPGTLYSPATDFTGTGFDPVAAGWTLVSTSVPALSSAALVLLCLLLAGGAARRLRR